MIDSSKESNYKISRRKQNFCELGLDMVLESVIAMFSIIKSAWWAAPKGSDLLEILGSAGLLKLHHVTEQTPVCLCSKTYRHTFV